MVSIRRSNTMLPRSLTMREQSGRPLVQTLRELPASVPEAQGFLHDWPRDLVARPVGKRSLPILAALGGLERLAALRTQGLLEGIEVLAGETLRHPLRRLRAARGKTVGRWPGGRTRALSLSRNRGQQKDSAFPCQKPQSVPCFFQPPDEPGSWQARNEEK